jgi:outer membrane protein TolC
VAALALAAGVLFVVHDLQKPVIVITPDTPPPALAHAIDLRNQARAAYDTAQWQTVIDDLDQARALDPAGDARPETQKLRADAEQARKAWEAPKPPPGPPPDDRKVVPYK